MVLRKIVLGNIEVNFVCLCYRAVEQHLQTFRHREKKKVRTSELFDFSRKLLKIIRGCPYPVYLSILTSEIFFVFSCPPSLIGLGGAHGMPSTKMSQLKVLNKGFKRKIEP